MNPPFAPTFQDFQKDTERHLERAGMTEKNEHGQTVYRGYYTALSQMFRLYIEKEAFAPLVAEFRRWNWEWDYGDDLMELTDCLRRSRDWPLLKSLWAAVVAKAQDQLQQDKKGSEVCAEQCPRGVGGKDPRPPPRIARPASRLCL